MVNQTVQNQKVSKKESDFAFNPAVRLNGERMSKGMIGGAPSFGLAILLRTIPDISRIVQPNAKPTSSLF